MDDFTDQLKPIDTHITHQPAKGHAPPDLPDPRGAAVKTDVLGYVLVFLGVVALTVLMAVIGGVGLVVFATVVIVLGLIHYWTWGRSLNRRVAEERAKLFRQELGVDHDHLSEVERPRHY